MWVDPPYYFPEIVYPAYIRAHAHLFENDDVEHGRLIEFSDDAAAVAVGQTQAPDYGAPVANLVLIDPLEMSVEELLARACTTILNYAMQSGMFIMCYGAVLLTFLER